VQDAIQRERREEEVKPASFWDWLDTILNIVILSSLLYAIYVIYKKYSRPAVINPVRTL
jgi:hypothetical protein